LAVFFSVEGGDPRRESHDKEYSFFPIEYHCPLRRYARVGGDIDLGKPSHIVCRHYAALALASGR
jgi:hypothetical protein